MKVYFTNIVYSILACLTIFGCNHTDVHNSSEDLILPEENSIKKVEVTQRASTSNLPFTESSVNRKTPHPLPVFDSIVYLPLNTAFDFNFTDRVALKHLTFFNNQLPAIHNYQVYYAELNCYEKQDSMLNSVCSSFADLTAGFLIIQDTTTKIAHILNIKNNYYIDSGIDMTFVIDEGYKIHLTETGMTDGDVEEDEPMITESYLLSKHLIEIGQNGSVDIQEI
jgi:hypothetical protein